MNEVKSLLNIKNIIILSLLLISIFFCWKWITSTDSELKIKNKLLEDKVKSMQIERDSLANDRVLLENRYDSLSNIVDKESEKLKYYKNELRISKLDLEKSKRLSDDYRKKYDSIDISIRNFKKTPINRTGDNLLNSLKNKLN